MTELAPAEFLVDRGQKAHMVTLTPRCLYVLPVP